MSIKYRALLFTITTILSFTFVSCTKPPENSETVQGDPTIATEPSSINEPELEAPNYSGEWKRTGVIRGAGADLTITNEKDDGFDFRLTAFWGDHFGDIYGRGIKKDSGEAAYIIEPEEPHEGGVLNFMINEENFLIVSYEGDHSALDFGQNALPDGTYTLRDPDYISDKYPMLVFGDEKMLNRVKALMVETNEFDDESAFYNLITIMKAGMPELVGPHRYKGYLPPGRSMTVDLIITENDDVHILAHNLDERPYVFYTTHIDYYGHGVYPEGLDIPPDVEIEPVYHPNAGY